MAQSDSSNTGTSDPIIIIGGGQAAVQLCLALRREKVTTPVLMLSEESEYPYHKPPLSKSFLSGEITQDNLAMRPASFFESKDIDLRLETRVAAIDPAARTVSTDSDNLRYQTLVIATGATPRTLEINETTLEGVHVLRDLSDSLQLKHQLQTAKNIVVIGAGFIGLEFAAVANKLGGKVTVFDMAERVMARAVSPLVSDWYVDMHRSSGVDIRLGESVTQLHGEGRVQQVTTTESKVIDCDLLLVGIGVVPNDEIASGAGVKCDNGIVVDEFCRTSLPDIFAIGDCARHPNPFARLDDEAGDVSGGGMVRLESIQNATDQARTVAGVIAGKNAPYNSVPWFWSDQGEHSLQMAGLSNNADKFVSRGDPESGSFSVFHFYENKLQSVDSVNSPKDHMLARKLISARLSPTHEQAADTDFDLKSLL